MAPPLPLVAVTGGTGFVGSHIVEALLATGTRVRALVRRPEKPGWLKGLDVEVHPGDVCDSSSLAALVKGADAVVHVAGKTSARDLTEYLAANAGGVKNVAEVVRAVAPGAHVVLISSQAAAGPAINGVARRTEDAEGPVSSYGRSKLEGERELRKVAGLKYTILRPGAVYGPREAEIRDLFVAASRGIVPVLAGGRPRVQLIYALDVAAAVLGALKRGGRGESFFLAHPEVLDYRLIADTLAGLRSPRARTVPVPAGLIRAAGVLVGAVSSFGKGPPVFNREKAGEMLQPGWLCDVEPARQALGDPFQTTFASGSKLTWDWYRANGILR
ncbi:MAG: NAD-dependent epimerase/dehydratase family protein [Acidobacteria bacterium]|nr:NAD-dependent epimerase/dehydratase family protein [Acidobacteriota bacterium]